MIPQIRLNNVVKMFGNVRANDGVSIEIDRGTVHSIIGENGAGKSTSMNILYGLLKPDDGVIEIDGKPQNLSSPRDAIKLGIGMVHQEFMLAPTLTVLENVILGLEHTNFKLLDYDRAKTKIKSIIERLELPIPLNEKIFRLPVSLQQRVEIVKLLYRGADILILDEPTAVLAPQEVDSFFMTIRALREMGKTVIFITHKLKEVMQISDQITIMRNGKVVGKTIPSKTSEKELAKLMVGKESLSITKVQHVSYGDEIFAVKGISVKNERGFQVVEDVSFRLHKGEILGIAGVAGNGQHELIEALFGLRKRIKGDIWLNGVQIKHCDPKEMRSRKVAYIPQDRIGVGSAINASVVQNAIMGHHMHPPIRKGPAILKKQATLYCSSMVQKYGIKLGDIRSNFSHLSGGNKQKTIVGRELSGKPIVLLAEDPTRGVDIGAARYIRQQLVDETKRGMGVILVSQDLQEVMELSDRVAVMYKGKLVMQADRADISEYEIGYYMTGSKE